MLRLLLGALALLFPAAQAQAQEWPTKPVTIYMGFPAGSGVDVVARLLQPSLEKTLGQRLVIDYKSGAGGNVASETVARAPADGYTFLHTVSGTIVQNRVLYDQLGFDPDKDFVPVSATSSGELPIAVHKSVPANNIKELIEYAKTNRVSFGSWAPGSAAHIVCAKLNALYGVKMEIVHYRGEGPMWIDMGSGSLQVAMGSYQALQPLMVKGDIKVIALPARRRNPKFPDLPTMTEQGYTHMAFSLFGWLGLFAPAGTSMDVVNRMSAMWVEAANSEGGRKMYESFGLHEKPLNHEEMVKDLEVLKGRMIPLVKELGVKLS